MKNIFFLLALSLFGCSYSASFRAQKLPTGTALNVRLLTSVTAESGSTNTTAIFACEDPNCFQLSETNDDSNIFIIAKAHASSVDSRLLFRAKEIIDANTLKIISLDGWIVGEDSLPGLQGILLKTQSEFYVPKLQANGANNWSVVADNNATTYGKEFISVLASRRGTLVISKVND
jgi:hypothetical protein